MEDRGVRLYNVLALFDVRDGSPLSRMIQAAREGYERSHPDMDEEDAWAEFDAWWSSFTMNQRTKMALDLMGKS